MFNQNILILGGMGPQASLLLHERLIQHASKMGAKQPQDFPAITHLSMPHEEFISNPTRTSKALEIIKRHLYCLWRSRIHPCGDRLQYRPPLTARD